MINNMRNMKLEEIIPDFNNSNNSITKTFKDYEIQIENLMKMIEIEKNLRNVLKNNYGLENCNKMQIMKIISGIESEISNMKPTKSIMLITNKVSEDAITIEINQLLLEMQLLDEPFKLPTACFKPEPPLISNVVDRVPISNGVRRNYRLVKIDSKIPKPPSSINKNGLNSIRIRKTGITIL
jgi:hypothetical protein